MRGDADVDFQFVADVINVAHHAGVQRVGLLTTDREAAGNTSPCNQCYPATTIVQMSGEEQ